MTAALAVAVRMKSPEAFRTISEVSTELDVPQHVLRFWESRFNQIRPLKRAGGRRFYRPEDVDLLRGIRTLLYHEGYTIKGVQKVLRDRGHRHVAEIGRNDAATLHDAVSFVSSSEIPEDSMDALMTLARMHAEASETIVDDRREDLEMLLDELLALKLRLLSARSGIG
jgi:DNA-binding transcriptional MerR regulator